MADYEYDQYYFDYLDDNESITMANKTRFTARKMFVSNDRATKPCTICKVDVYVDCYDDHCLMHGFIPERTKTKKKPSKQLSIGELIKTCEDMFKSAGWEVNVSETIAYDKRRGFSISALEPKKEEANVKPNQEK